MEGTIFSVSKTKDYLRNANKSYDRQQTWKQMFTANDLQGAQAQENLMASYAGAANDAYATYLQNKSGILNSNIVGSGLQNILQGNEAALTQAYNSYRNNAAENSQAIAESVAKGTVAIDKALTDQAEMTTRYAQSHFDYLEKLYEQYEAGENDIFNDKRWQKFLTTEVDEDGNEVTRLLRQDELIRGAEEGTALYDAENNLTLRGADFFDQIENLLAQEGGYSFGDYLLENESDLHDWANNYNPYNYTDTGSNKGSFNTMTGRTSTDQTYSFVERFGGLTEKEIESHYESFNKAFEELSSRNLKDKAKVTMNDLKGISTELSSLVSEFGLGDYVDVSKLDTVIERSLEHIKSGGEMTGDFISELMLTTGLSSGAFAMAGSVLPGVGNIAGAVVGAIAGFIGGLAKVSEKTDKQRKANEQAAKLSLDAYKELLVELTNASNQIRDTAKKEFDSQANLF